MLFSSSLCWNQYFIKLTVSLAETSSLLPYIALLLIFILTIIRFRLSPFDLFFI